MNVDILEAVPAAGKTAAFLEYIKETNQKAIVSSISRQLSRQSYNFFNKMGGQNSVIIDSDNKKENQSVTKTLANVMEKKTPNVIFVTHAALLQSCDFSLFKGYHLYIDEVPDMVSLDMMKLTVNSYKVLSYCMPIGGSTGSTYNLRLDETRREELTEIAYDGFNQNDEIASKLLPIYESLLNGHPVRFRRGDDSVSQFYYIKDLTNQQWEVFTGITIACANFDKTFTGYILKYWNGWTFSKSHLHDKLRFEAYTNTDRVKISVMIDQTWSRCVADKSIGETSLYNKIQDMVQTMYPEGNFLYTTNSFRSRMLGHQIQYNPHGLNMYSHANHIVALFSYNPQPWQIPILTELASMQDLEDNELIDAFLVSKYLEPIFQLCTRGDIRNNDSTKTVHLVVPDMRAAMYLKNNYLPDAVIDVTDVHNVDLTPAAPKDYNWKSRGVSAVLEMTPKERRAFYYFCKKSNKKATDFDPTEPSHLLEVKNWLTKHRESN
ncbi:MAG: hypothetical protein ACRCWQ_02260 [Bacilli bacterium]